MSLYLTFEGDLKMRNLLKPATLAFALIAAGSAGVASAAEMHEMTAEPIVGQVTFNGQATPLDADDVYTNANGMHVYMPDPVLPEADTLSLMAVGLGLIGLRLRRKSK